MIGRQGADGIELRQQSGSSFVYSGYGFIEIGFSLQDHRIFDVSFLINIH